MVAATGNAGHALVHQILVLRYLGNTLARVEKRLSCIPQCLRDNAQVGQFNQMPLVLWAFDGGAWSLLIFTLLGLIEVEAADIRFVSQHLVECRGVPVG